MRGVGGRVAGSVGVIICTGALLLAGCGGSGNAKPFSAPTTGSPPSTIDLRGNENTSTIAALAQQLGCTDVSADNQVERHADSEATCLFQGQTLALLGFPDDASEQAWFDTGPETADNSGTVVLGDKWAIALFEPSQASAVQHVVGGTVKQMS